MIDTGIGLAAVIVLLLAIFRGVTHRDSLVLTISDAVIALGVAIETRANRLWRFETRELTYWQRYDYEGSSLIRLLDWFASQAFEIGWRLEDRALGPRNFHFHEPNTAFGLAAASEVRSSDVYDAYDPDDYDYLDDPEYAAYEDSRYEV